MSTIIHMRGREARAIITRLRKELARRESNRFKELLKSPTASRKQIEPIKSVPKDKIHEIKMRLVAAWEKRGLTRPLTIREAINTEVKYAKRQPELFLEYNYATDVLARRRALVNIFTIIANKELTLETNISTKKPGAKYAALKKEAVEKEHCDVYAKLNMTAGEIVEAEIDRLLRIYKLTYKTSPENPQEISRNIIEQAIINVSELRAFGGNL